MATGEGDLQRSQQGFVEYGKCEDILVLRFARVTASRHGAPVRNPLFSFIVSLQRSRTLLTECCCYLLSQVLEFARTVEPDLSNYEVDGVSWILMVLCTCRIADEYSVTRRGHPC